MAAKKALVVVAPGSEEMETVITVDVLRRAGIDVTLAGLAGKEPIKCSRSLVLVPDDSLANAAASGLFDAVILPGGLDGSHAFAASAEVGQVLKAHESGGKIVAAICAAPIAFKSHGIAVGKKITSHPCKAEDLKADYTYLEERVVQDGQVITSRAPGTAFEFALALVTNLVGSSKASEITPGMLLH